MPQRPERPREHREGESDKEQDRIRLEQARKAPLRARILALYKEDSSRSLEPSDLLGDLSREFGELSLAHIEYHLGRLRELEMIPPSRPEGDSPWHP
jgi:DNA-binding transcriptional ArsR family regulator